MTISVSSAEAFFWCCFLHYPASFIPAAFLHFVQNFLGIQLERKQIFLRRLFYAVGLLFMAAAFNPYFIKTVLPRPGFPFYLEPGPAYVLFFILFVAGILTVQSLLFLTYRRAEGFKKTQIGYVFIAYALSYAGGMAVFLPVYHLSLPSGALYLIPIGHSLVAYAILRHQLMDINVIVRRTLLYSLLTAGLASVYAGAVTLLARLLASAISAAFAAVFITLLFNPLRMRLQRWIDRQFPREQLDPTLLQEAAGGFAHEMKRPLSKIALPAELALQDLERLRTGELSLEEGVRKVKERLKIIMHQSMDAGSMIEAIRSLSTVSVTPFSVVDIGLLVKDTLQEEKEVLARHGVSENLSLPSERLHVLGHANQLKIVFMNLIKNAAEAMGDLPPGEARELSVVLSLKGNQAVVDFKDTGAGIKQEDLGKVFQPNYSTKGARGSGIGLYLSYSIIQAHRGTMMVSSLPSGGTEFSISLSIA